MKKALNISALLAGIIAVATVTACTNTGATKTEKPDGVEWNVSVNRVVSLNDPALGINTDSTYTVADTARVNEQLTGLAQRENVSLSWTMPGADGDIWLVAYENEPVLSERVSIAATNPISAHDGNIQVAFKFFRHRQMGSNHARQHRKEIGNIYERQTDKRTASKYHNNLR